MTEFFLAGAIGLALLYLAAAPPASEEAQFSSPRRNSAGVRLLTRKGNDWTGERYSSLGLLTDTPRLPRMIWRTLVLMIL